MTVPFLNGGKKRDQVFAVDLGSRVTKAVLLTRNQERFKLSRFAIQDAPVYEKGLSEGLLTEHLRAIVRAIEPRTRQLTLAVGSSDSVLRMAEMPLLPLNDMRQMLRLNPKFYLQQNLTDYVFDCYFVPPRGKDALQGKASSNVKYKAWIGGMRRDFLATLEAGVKGAGLVADQVTLAVLGPVNAFELAQPETFLKESTALVDLGFKTSTINVVSEGDLALSRAVEIGGDKLTAGLAEAMGITYAEAEGIKIGMPQEVESHLQPLVAPLGRELRASIDFFEHDRDKTVSQVLICGGACRSDYILQLLQAELGVPCKAWNNPAGLEPALNPQQTVELEQVVGQLTVSIGAASTLF